jgi:hypothetical protein
LLSAHYSYPLHVETGRPADPGQGVDERAALVPKVRQTAALVAPPSKRRIIAPSFSASIAGDGRLDGGGPKPQRSRYVCLRYKMGCSLVPASSSKVARP